MSVGHTHGPYLQFADTSAGVHNFTALLRNTQAKIC